MSNNIFYKLPAIMGMMIVLGVWSKILCTSKKKKKKFNGSDLYIIESTRM
jgi:hypothetical protein